MCCPISFVFCKSTPLGNITMVNHIISTRETLVFPIAIFDNRKFRKCLDNSRNLELSHLWSYPEMKEMISIGVSL